MKINQDPIDIFTPFHFLSGIIAGLSNIDPFVFFTGHTIWELFENGILGNLDKANNIWSETWINSLMDSLIAFIGHGITYQKK